MKKYSSDYYKNNGQYGDRPALGMYFKILKHLVTSGSKVLEFGAGNGFLSKRIATEYISDAIELSSHARNNIRNNSPQTTIVKSENFLEKNHYDAIISLHTFEHLEKPREIVKKILAGLKPKGILIVVMPNPEGWGHKLKGKDWFAYKDPTHVSLLKRMEWESIFLENDLTIIKSGSDWFWDPPYLPVIPNFIQKLIFYPGCLLMVLVGRIFYPDNWGEDMILVARKN